MAQSMSLVQEGLDRVRSVVKSVDKELQRVQKRVAAQRKQLEKRTSQQVDRTLTQLRESPLGQRAESLRSEASQRLEASVEGVLAALQIASKSDLQKIDRKLSQLTRKLKDIEKGAPTA